MSLKLSKYLKGVADSDPRKAKALATMLIEYADRNLSPIQQDTKSDAIDRIRSEISHLGLEQFCAVVYDSNERFVALWKGGVGSINRSTIFVRTLVQNILNVEGMTVYLAHNHPSGSTKPSTFDVRTKDILERLFDSLGISISMIIVTSTDTIFY